MKLNYKTLMSFFVFVVIVFGVIVGPFLWTIDATYIDIRARNSGPSLAHPLGTDQLGRDMLARMIAGGKVSISVGFTAMFLSLVLGTFIGVLAGQFKKLDGPLMRFTDLFLALPLLPLLLVMVMLFRETLSMRFGPETGTFILIVTAIGVTSWMNTARIVRADVLALKELEFVTAARSIGTKPSNIISHSSSGTPNSLDFLKITSRSLSVIIPSIRQNSINFISFSFTGFSFNFCKGKNYLKSVLVLIIHQKIKEHIIS